LRHNKSNRRIVVKSGNYYEQKSET
jgi:hypothetical protein